jgi:transporter family protein
MDSLTAILFGLVGLFGWGVSDFFARKVIEKHGHFNTYFFLQLISGVIFFVYCLFLSEFKAFSFETGALLVLIGIIWAFSGLTFFKSIQIGKLGIVVPIASSWAVVSTLLSVHFFGEVLSTKMILGIFLVVLGVIMTSTKLSDLQQLRKGVKVLKGVDYAVVTFLSWGVMYALIKLVVDSLGPVVPLFYFRIFSLFLLACFTKATGKKLSFPKSSALLLFLMAVFDSAAFIGLTHGVQAGYVSLVAPVTSASPAVTVLLAFFFLGERFELNQKLGILSIISGLVLLALA